MNDSERPLIPLHGLKPLTTFSEAQESGHHRSVVMSVAHDSPDRALSDSALVRLAPHRAHQRDGYFPESDTGCQPVQDGSEAGH